MDIAPLHRWDLSPAQARALQKDLAADVDTSTPLGPCRLVAAADVSYNRGEDHLHAAVVVLEAGTGRVVDRAGVTAPAAFPYVPGLLSFRELPAVLLAFERLRETPDVVLCDGQGLAHPRRLGLACHLGLWLGLPTVGCAKSHLFGLFSPPGPERGDRSPLTDRAGAVLGAVLRSRRNVSPLFVSPGHLCDLESSIRLVLEWATKYRLPEPARQAHDYVNELRRNAPPPPTPPTA